LDPVSAEIWENKEIATGIYRLKLRPYGPAPRVAPGRFFMIGVGPGTDPLLRRPLSHLATSVNEDGIQLLEFLYEVRGRGTELLSLLQPPRIISYIGPLGNGWRRDGVPRRVILAGGGAGAVPLYAASKALAEITPRPKIEFIYGARTGRCLALASEIGVMVEDTVLCTEDGCRGEKGLVTDLLRRALTDADPARTLVLACGPRAMLAQVALLTKERGVACQVSLEARMACGMGACLTCSIRGADGHNVRVCKEGPVFDAAEVDWEALDECA